jgi:hypothetical protein
MEFPWDQNEIIGPRRRFNGRHHGDGAGARGVSFECEPRAVGYRYQPETLEESSEKLREF